MGSVNDEAYHFGYVDAQRGHNDAIHKHRNHTDEWRTGYRDGFAIGQQDKANGIDKNARTVGLLVSKISERFLRVLLNAALNAFSELKVNLSRGD